MNNKMIQVEKEPTEEQLKVIEQVIAMLDEAELELIGTRPKDRK
jgi:hypothetical protein